MWGQAPGQGAAAGSAPPRERALVALGAQNGDGARGEGLSVACEAAETKRAVVSGG